MYSLNEPYQNENSRTPNTDHDRIYYNTMIYDGTKHLDEL